MVDEPQEQIRSAAQYQTGSYALGAYIRESPLSVAIFDNGLHLIDASHSWLNRYSLANSSSLRGHHLYDLGISIFANDKSLHQRALKGEYINGEEDLLINQEGTAGWYKWALRPWFKDPEIIGGIVMSIEEVTEKRQKIYRLETQNQILESQVHDQGEDLKLQNRKLLALNQDLNQFVSFASHDLSEPLRAISGYLALLDKKLKGHLDPKSTQYLSEAMLGAERMQKMVSGLLQYSRLGQSPLKPAIFSCEEQCKSIERSMGAELHGKKLSFSRPTELPELFGVAGQFRTLLKILIDNARTFTDKACPFVALSFKPKGPFYEFTLIDDGLGIDPQHIERIFKIFQKVHLGPENFGIGLGLSLARKIVELHGGQIWVNSKPGVGSQFSFTFPGAKGHVEET